MTPIGPSWTYMILDPESWTIENWMQPSARLGPLSCCQSSWKVCGNRETGWLYIYILICIDLWHLTRSLCALLCLARALCKSFQIVRSFQRQVSTTHVPGWASDAWRQEMRVRISMDILWYLASFVLPILSHFEFFQTWSSGFQFHKIFSSSTATVNKGWVYQGLPALRRVCGTRGTACWVTTLRRYDSVVILYDPTCKHGVNGATKLHILILWTHKSTYFFNHLSPRLSPNQGHTSSSISISRIWNRSSSRWWRSWVTRCRAVT